MENQTFTKLYHKLGRKIGPLEALTLQFLADLQQNVFPGKPFFQQQDRIAETLGISIRQVQTYTKKLKALNLITYNRGVGALYYYTVNLKAIDTILAEEEVLGKKLIKIVRGKGERWKDGVNYTNKNSDKERKGYAEKKRKNREPELKKSDAKILDRWQS